MGKSTRKIPGLRLRGDVYYADTRVKGIRLSQRIGKVNESTAKAILAKLISDVWKDEYFPKKVENLSTVYDICNKYYEEKLIFKKSKDTRKYLFMPITRLLGDKIAKDLRISEVEEYQRIRQSEKKKIIGKEIDKLVSAPTVNHEVKELLTALRWAVKNRLLDYNPIEGITHLKEPEPAKIMLDEGVEFGDDWRRLYNAIGEKNYFSGKLTIRGKKTKLKFLMQYKTGMRIGEINQMQHSWIDQIAMKINLPGDVTKSAKSRIIPIDMELIQAINDYKSDCANTPLSNDKYLFYNQISKTHDKRSDRAFNSAVERAGLKGRGITSHALRRTRGTIWDSIDERASMEVLGHSDFAVHRKHYTKVTEDRIRKLTLGADNRPPNKNTAQQNY